MTSRTSFDSQALEARFLARWPHYQTWLDEERLRSAVMPVLTTARRRSAPFAHVFVQGVLPSEFFDLLSDAWPPNDACKPSRNPQKFDLVPRDDQSYEYSAPYGALPPCIRDVWNFFVYVINRRIVGPWLAGVFESEIHERLALLARVSQEGNIGFRASGLTNGHFEANSGRFMVRGRGYRLEPHVDPASYLVTALHYFPDGPDEDWGTALFKAERPIPLDAFLADGTTEYFHRHDIAAHEVMRLPFARNCLLAFPNLLDAAHGVISPEDGYRKVFQYHLVLEERFRTSVKQALQ